MYGNPQNTGYGDPSTLGGIEGTPAGFGSPQVVFWVTSGLLEVGEDGGEVVIEAGLDWPDGPIEVVVLPVNVRAVLVRMDGAFLRRLVVQLPPLCAGRYSIKVITSRGSFVLSDVLFVLPERGHHFTRIRPGISLLWCILRLPVHDTGIFPQNFPKFFPNYSVPLNTNRY